MAGIVDCFTKIGVPKGTQDYILAKRDLYVKQGLDENAASHKAIDEFRNETVESLADVHNQIADISGKEKPFGIKEKKVDTLENVDAKFIAQQAQNIQSDGSVSNLQSSESAYDAAVKAFTKPVVDAAIKAHPLESLVKQNEQTDVLNENVVGAKEALDKYENSNYTEADIADHIENLDIPELKEAIDKFREEQDYDRELSGRGDMDTANDNLIAAVEKYIKDTPQPKADVPIEGKTFNEKQQELINDLPKKKVNYKDIKGIGDLVMYLNNPDALNSPLLRSAKKIYEDIKNGKAVKDTPSVNEKMELMDGQNRIAAQLAAGIENIDVAVIDKSFYDKQNKNEENSKNTNTENSVQNKKDGKGRSSDSGNSVTRQPDSHTLGNEMPKESSIKKPTLIDKEGEQSEKSEPLDTVPSIENKKSILNQDKPIPAFHKKVDDVADSLIKALSAKLPPGTQKQGAGDIATIIRAAADIIKKAHDIGGDIKKAVDEAVAYVKKQFADNNLGEVDEDLIRQHFGNQGITGETPPPKPPVDNVTEEGDAENRLTAKFKAWTPITKDKTIIQDVKETHEKRTEQDLFNENYEREQRDKAATDLSIDLLVQEARTELQDGYLDYLVDLVQTGDLLESAQHGIIQSLMWRQGLTNDIINNLSVLDKTLATKASDNMMMRRAMGGKDDISDTQEEMIESALGEEGSTLKTMQENLEAARRDNTIPEEIQEAAAQVTTQEIEQEIKEEQEEIVAKPKQSSSKPKKIDTGKFQAKAELIRTELSKKTGDNFLSTLIDNINKIAAIC